MVTGKRKVEKMSAFIVDREHVAYLVDAAQHVGAWGRLCAGPFRWRWAAPNGEGCVEGILRPGDYERAVEIGQMLWDECITSVSACYPNEPVEDLPGIEGEDYEFKQADLNPRRQFEAAQIMKSCDCFDYQSCEHPGWNKSEANAFIVSLREAASTAVPGYEQAEWGAPKA